MNINLVYDSAALAAPQSFRDGMQAAANIIGEAFTDNITVNISVGYGELDGEPIDPNVSLGGGYVDAYSYTLIRSSLASRETSADDINSVNALPTGSSIQGFSSEYLLAAQEKAFGLINPGDSGIDGIVAIGTGFVGDELIAAGLHEITHAMGRLPGTSLDLFRFDSAGHRVFGDAIPATASYFSVDGGHTAIADFGTDSDPGDFLDPSARNLTPDDPFDEFVGPSTVTNLTSADLRVMDVLGFTRNPHYIGGTPFDDALSGTASADKIWGDGGNDTISGGDGNDLLYGGDGNDIVHGNGGSDVLSGGNGVDLVSYATATAAVTVDLSRTTSQNTGGAGMDRLSGFEKASGSIYNDMLMGTSGDDVLTGNAGNDKLNGGAGNDTLDGGSGIDAVSYSTATAAATVSLAIGGAQNSGGGGTDTLISIESLYGSRYGDTFTGNSSANTLTGAAGNDGLSGGLGNDLLNGGAGNDTVNGGSGTDTASYDGASAGVKVSLSLAGAQNTVGAGTDSLISIESLQGSGFADTLTGGGGNNALGGGAGDDILIGGGGADTLTGGLGSDKFAYMALTDSTAAKRDLIKDHAATDRIDLTAIDADTGIAGDQAFHQVASFGHHAGEYMLAYNAATSLTTLSGDVNGDAVADIVIDFTGDVTGLTAAWLL